MQHVAQRALLPHVCQKLSSVTKRPIYIMQLPAGRRMVVSCAAPRKVILTNDDGPDSPFFNAWVSHVRNELRWNAVVCQPASPQSFVSKGMTRDPIKVHRRTAEDFDIESSPASCVNLALHNLVADADLVISGPNVGHNAGSGSVLSSGTVGAAMEAAIAGCRAIAISFPFFHGWNNWTSGEIGAAVRVAGRLSTDLFQSWDGQPGPDLYNVNIPVSVDEHSYEVQFTTVDTAATYQSLYALNEATGCYEWSPKGLRVFQLEETQPGSDVEAIKAKNVSVTPLQSGFARCLHTTG